MDELEMLVVTDLCNMNEALLEEEEKDSNLHFSSAGQFLHNISCLSLPS